MKLGLLFSLLATSALAANPIVVGSKKFTESYVLGEIAKTVLERAGFDLQQRPGMGGTILLCLAHRVGRIDVATRHPGRHPDTTLKQPLSESTPRGGL